MITNRYGSISRKNVAERPGRNGFSTPRIRSTPWSPRMNGVIAANRYAPSAARTGFQRAKITRPTAIQPRPFTVWSPNQPGATARVIVAPASPARTPPSAT